MNIGVLEDHPLTCDMLHEMLELHGHAVRVYTTGRECLEDITSEKWLNQGPPFEVLLVDLMLPSGIQGEEVLARMQVLHPTIPLVVISATSSQDLHDIHTLYNVKVLQKPFKMRDLLALIEGKELPLQLHSLLEGSKALAHS